MELLHRVRDFMIRHRMVEQALKWLSRFRRADSWRRHILNYFKDELKISLHVAHLNHQFRSESDEDASFVAYGRRYGLPCTIEADVEAIVNRNDVQAGSCKGRYGFY